MTSSESRQSGMVLRDVRLISTCGESGRRCDVSVSDGRVESLLPVGTARARGDQEVLDMDGRFLMPGLWDHHVHFTQWALVRQRVDLSGCTSARAVADTVAARLTAEPPPAGTALIGYGFRDGLWPDSPEISLLDGAAAGTPVILISADLHCAWLSTAAHRMLDITADGSGLLREEHCRPVQDFLRRADKNQEDTAALDAAQAAAARGVVGVVDLETDLNLENWTRRVQAGNRNLRIACGVWQEHLDDAITRGLRTGDVLADTAGLVSMGPFKISLDGSLNTRTAYCYYRYPEAGAADGHGLLLVPPARLVSLMLKAMEHDIECAVHAIGDHANSVALDAFERVSARGTIEHAQLLAPGDIGRFAKLGVVASVQPAHTRSPTRTSPSSTGRAAPAARTHFVACSTPVRPWCSAPMPLSHRSIHGSAWRPRWNAAVRGSRPGTPSKPSTSVRRCAHRRKDAVRCVSTILRTSS